MTLARIEDFALERYFARWEFVVRHQLSASDLEPFTLSEVLELADDDARDRWSALSLGYTESSGLPALRDAIAATYQTLDASHVLVVAGAEEGIFLAMHALLGADDEAVVVAPAYQSLHAVATAARARVKLVFLRPDHGWRLDVDEIAHAVTPRTRAIVINFPHNPTGAHISSEDLRTIAAIADDADAVLFSDEVYRGLEYSANEVLPAAADVSPRAVSLGVMSKSFALAGLRIGWLASKDADLRARVARLKDYTTICSSAPSEILALIALRARERVLRRSREIVSGNLAVATDFMAECHERVEWIAPRAGSVAFPRFRRLQADAVAQTLAERENTLMLPGSLFGYDPSYFRIGLGRRDFPAALARLKAVL